MASTALVRDLKGSHPFTGGVNHPDHTCGHRISGRAWRPQLCLASWPLSPGMMLGGGCGRELAHWIIHGRPEKDMYGYDIRQVTLATPGPRGLWAPSLIYPLSLGAPWG